MPCLLVSHFHRIQIIQSRRHKALECLLYSHNFACFGVRLVCVSQLSNRLLTRREYEQPVLPRRVVDAFRETLGLGDFIFRTSKHGFFCYFQFFVYVCVGLCGGDLHESAGSHRGQKVALEWGGGRMTGIVSHLMWLGPKFDPLQEQSNLITAEPSPQPLYQPFDYKFSFFNRHRDIQTSCSDQTSRLVSPF